MWPIISWVSRALYFIAMYGRSYFYFKNKVFHLDINSRPPNYKIGHQPVLSAIHDTTAKGRFCLVDFSQSFINHLWWIFQNTPTPISDGVMTIWTKISHFWDTLYNIWYLLWGEQSKPPPFAIEPPLLKVNIDITIWPAYWPVWRNAAHNIWPDVIITIQIQMREW